MSALNQIVERMIGVKAENGHMILPHDSIEELCMSHRGLVMATRLAINLPDAVGCPAEKFNSIGRQVWTPKLLKTRNGKILRDL